MKNKVPVIEQKEKSKRILRFGLLALFNMLLSATIDFTNGLFISGYFIVTLAIILTVILLIVRAGHLKGAMTAIVISVNIFLVLIAFAEGLKTGGYLFILSLLFALPFLMSSFKLLVTEIAAYFFITVCAFCVCIIFCDETSTWQNISSALFAQMFRYNCICVVMLCALFAYMGIHFEIKYKAQLFTAKNKAEQQEQKIKKQNDHLQDIAFMNAHIIRAPLANIMAITDLLNSDKLSEEDNKELVQLLQTSAEQLDTNVKEIVAKTYNKTVI